MLDNDKILKGLECCQISMLEADPFAKCQDCPYHGISVYVNECRSVLSKDALELLKKRGKIRFNYSKLLKIMDETSAFQERAIKAQEHAIAVLEANKDRLKNGHWITKRTDVHDGEWYCDQCGYEPTLFENTPYCPKCGAKLELGR